MTGVALAFYFPQESTALISNLFRGKAQEPVTAVAVESLPEKAAEPVQVEEFEAVIDALTLPIPVEVAEVPCLPELKTDQKSENDPDLPVTDILVPVEGGAILVPVEGVPELPVVQESSPTPEPIAPVDDYRIHEIEELKLQKIQAEKKLAQQRRKLKNLNSSVEAVKSVISGYKENADAANRTAIEAVTLLEPSSDETAVRLEFEDRLYDFTLAAFLPDHGKAPGFAELLFAKFLTFLFSFEAAEKTDGLKSVAASYAGKNLEALYQARLAVRQAKMSEAAIILESGTLGAVKEATKEWAKKARAVAQENQSRDFAKAAVYSRLANLV